MVLCDATRAPRWVGRGRVRVEEQGVLGLSPIRLFSVCIGRSVIGPRLFYLLQDMSRVPEPPTSAIMSNTPPPGVGARKVIGRRSGGKQFQRVLSEPTREELRQGPSREELPKAVQEMPKSDTVCKFCGVSYLVFSEIKELEKRLLSSEDKIKEYTNRLSQFDQMKAALENLANKRENQQNQLAIMEEEWQCRTNAMKNRLEMLEDDNQELREVASTRKGQLNRQTRQLGRIRLALKREKESLLSIRSNTSTVMGDMESVMKSTLHEVNVMALRLKSETEAREAGDNLRRTLRGQMEALEIEWKADVARLEERLRLQAQERDDAHTQVVATLKEEHRIAEEDLKAGLQAEIEKNQELEGKLRALGAEMAAKSTNVEGREKALLDQLSATKAAVHASQLEVGSLQKTLDELRAELTNVQVAKKKLETEHSALKNDRDSLSVNLESVQKAREREANGFQKELKGAQSEIVELKIQLNSFKDLESTLADSKKQLQSALDTIKEQDTELDKLRANHGNALSETQTQLDAARAEYRASLERMRAEHAEEIERIKREHEGLFKELTEQHERKVEESKRHLSVAEGCARSAKVEKNELAACLEADRERIQVLVEQVNALRKEREDAEEKLLSQKGALDQLGMIKSRLKDKEMEVERLNAKLKEVADNGERETSEGLEMLEKHLIKLSDKVRKKDKEISNLEATVHRQCRERQGLLEEVSKLRRESSK